MHVPILSRAAHMAKEAVSPHYAFLDVGGDISKTLLILGSGRSGTTLLLNLLNAGNLYRRMDEPFRRDRVRAGRAFLWGQYLDPGDEAPRHRKPARRILSGRARGMYIDFRNQRRISSRRIVKDVAATNLAPWFRHWFPELRIVYMLRNPVAVAGSRVGLQYPDRLDEVLCQPALIDGQFGEHADFARRVAQSSDMFARHALRWCLENAVSVRMLSPEDAQVVFYEQLVTEPERELRRIGTNYGLPINPGAPALARRPSETDFRGRAGSGRAPLDLVRESVTSVSARDRSAVLEVVDRFDLGGLYGDEIMPRVEPSEVLRHAKHGENVANS